MAPRTMWYERYIFDRNTPSADITSIIDEHNNWKCTNKWKMR